MAGHSKWSNIKRKKGVTDAKKGKTFSKLSRYITVAASEGGGEPDKNPTLRLAIEKAKKENMPKENIDRAIKKGTGELAGVSYERVTYEGYGPGGVAFLVLTLTDNRNRTVSELRNLFSKAGGTLSTPGSTAYIFTPTTFEPTFTVSVEDDSELTKLATLLDALEDHDDVQDYYQNMAKI